MNELSQREAIESSTLGMVVVDSDGIVIFANPAAEKIFGAHAPRLIGARFGFPVISGESSEIDIFLDGEIKVAEMSVIAIEWEGMSSNVATLKDVTESRQPVRAPERRTERPMGEMLTEISTELVRLHREYFGRGPTKAITHLVRDTVVCMLGDGFTDVEHALIDQGGMGVVREIRRALNDGMQQESKRVVERISGRKVIAAMSQIHADPDIAAEVFVLEPLPPEPEESG